MSRIPPDLLDYAGRPVTGPKRRPGWSQWVRCDEPMATAPGLMVAIPEESGVERWRLKNRILVTSSLQSVLFRGAPRWQWLVSISCFGKRATDEVVARVLKDFDMPNAEEDNHFSGIARGFWRGIDMPPTAATECECKADETPHVEPDGFTWNESDDEEVRRQVDKLRRMGGALPPGTVVLTNDKERG